MSTGNNNYLSFFMWVFPLSFFAFQFILRLWPGLMMQEIMTQFSIDAGSFGLLAAFYYYGYAGMQIPMAFLLDKFGARIIVFTFATLCGLGSLLFTYTDNFYLALCSRLLIGAGSAVGFLGVSKVISEWFSNLHYARMIGFSFSIGLLGAIYGGKPLSTWVDVYGGQTVGLTLSLIAISIGACTYLVLRAPSNTSKLSANKITMAHCSTILKSKVIWILALANLLMVGALEGFADVWGIPYLNVMYGFSKADAALAISFIFIGMLFGGPLLAAISKRLGNYPVIAGCGGIITIVFTLLLSNMVTNWWTLSVLFFIIGIMCCYQVIVFAAGATLVATQQLGMTVAFLNCVNMLGGSFFHTLIGKIMDLSWDGVLKADGLKQYSSTSFHYALAVIPICALCGSLLVCFIQNQYASKREAA